MAIAKELGGATTLGKGQKMHTACASIVTHATGIVKCLSLSFLMILHFFCSLFLRLKILKYFMLFTFYSLTLVTESMVSERALAKLHRKVSKKYRQEVRKKGSKK